MIGEGKVCHTQVKEYSHLECEQLIADNRPDEVMLRWSEIRKMRDSGLVEFHVYTHSYKRWDRLSASRTERCRYVREDTLEGKRCLTENLVPAALICAGQKDIIIKTILILPENLVSLIYIQQKEE